MRHSSPMSRAKPDDYHRRPGVAHRRTRGAVRGPAAEKAARASRLRFTKTPSGTRSPLVDPNQQPDESTPGQNMRSDLRFILSLPQEELGQPTLAAGQHLTETTLSSTPSSADLAPPYQSWLQNQPK